MSSPQPDLVELVPIADISVDAWRRPINSDHVEALRCCLGDLPAILVSDDLRLVDGEHRLRAHLAAGRTGITVQRLPSAISDVELLALSVRANTVHGLPLTSKQRVEAAKDLLHAGWEGSNNALAALCGISRNRVKSIRRQVVAEGPPGVPQGHVEGGNQRRVGRDGKRYPTDPDEVRRAILQEHQRDPSVSNAHIARTTGASPTTVAKIRHELRRPPRTSGDFPRRSLVTRVAKLAVTAARRWLRRWVRRSRRRLA